MPIPSFPCTITIYNKGDNELLIYPVPGGSINHGPADNPFPLPVGGGISFWASSIGNYYQHATPPAAEAGIEEAPSDGQLYARRNGAWVVVPPAGLADAPNNGSLYGRMNAAWSIVPPAP